ncbi:MAG TPA: hypothetical protein VNT50_04405 [Microbacterium sp.]|uniref:hypothetical protein n=1 Tax=Microbacterium sp. TaxID=51671 RepID=UPI002CF3C700|nr:hypothetical protein [Microbacterium sp.]HWI30707.1 hypothetical protein [Microbacterium sp.]
MDSVLLDAPEGILARLGWDPRLDERARVVALARELVAAHENADATTVRVDGETPAQSGHHVQLEATVAGKPVPLTIKAVSFRTATVAAVADAAVPIGLDIRDLTPDEVTLREMRRHSHLIDGGSDHVLLNHWTRVQAVLAADGRGLRVHPEQVRLDAPLNKGWVSDRRVFYRLKDLSRDAWVITLAYGGFPGH